MSSHHFANKSFSPQDIPLTAIKFRPNHRPVVQATVDALAISLGEDGLQSPIILSSRTGDRVLVAGRHRMEAARQRGWQSIPSFVVAFKTEDEEEMCELSENLARAELSAAQEAVQTARYLELTGKTLKAKAVEAAHEMVKPAWFAPEGEVIENVVEAVVVQNEPAPAVEPASAVEPVEPKISERTIEHAAGVNHTKAVRARKIAEGITPEALAKADKAGFTQTQLLELASYDDADQIEAVDTIMAAKEQTKATSKTKGQTTMTADEYKATAKTSKPKLDIGKLAIKAGTIKGTIVIRFGKQASVTLAKALWIERANEILKTVENM